MKRIVLFVLTNLAVITVLGLVMSLIGATHYLSSKGLPLSTLLVFFAMLGFGGALLSLHLSKPLAKWIAGVRVIKSPQNTDEAWIMETVQKLALKAGIGMPEVGIFDDEPNALATGAFRDYALVAVSTGLLREMTHDEVEAVIGHEIAHIANGDMVTLTLIQGVMNTFVGVISRGIGYLVDKLIFKSVGTEKGLGYYITEFIMDLCFGFAGSMLVAWFSRQCEFRADSGGAQLMNQHMPMINALARLGGLVLGEPPKVMPSMGMIGGMVKLFSTHPSIQERITSLQQSSENTQGT